MYLPKSSFLLYKITNVNNRLSYLASIGEGESTTEQQDHTPWHTIVYWLPVKQRRCWTDCPTPVWTYTQTDSEGEVLPYALASAGPGADPSVQADNCHYFPPGLLSPSQPKNVTVLQPVSSYTALCQRHKCEQLAQGCYAALSWWELNPRPTDPKPNVLPLLHCAN